MEEQTCRDLLAKLQQQDDASWKREALRKFTKYFSENKTLEARQAMVALGGHTTVMASMAAFPHDVALQVEALRSLWNLAADDALLCQRMLQEGCLDAVLAPMKALPKEAEVQEDALACLANFANVNTAEWIATLYEKGSQPLKAAMLAFPTIVAIQVEALRSLRNLSAYPCSEKLLQRMRREGCVDAVLAPMKAFPKDAVVQEHSVVVLWNLAIRATNKQSFAQCCEPVRDVLTSFPSSPNLQSWGAKLLKLLPPTQPPAKPSRLKAHDRAGGIAKTDRQPIRDFARTVHPTKSVHAHFADEVPVAFPGIKREFIDFYLSQGKKVVEERLARGITLATHLDEMELFAVAVYTMDAQAGDEQNIYVQLNNALLLRSKDVLPSFANFLHFLMRGLEKIPPVQPDPTGPATQLFRGIPAKHLDDVRAKYFDGRDIHWSSLTSVSFSEKKARSFAGPGGILFKVKARSARPVWEISAYQEEEEAILPPNFKAFVSAALYQPAGDPSIWVIELVERPDDAKTFYR